MNQAPWTEIGRLQSDLRDLQNKLSGKADDWKIHELENKIRNLENRISNFESNLEQRISQLEFDNSRTESGLNNHQMF